MRTKAILVLFFILCGFSWGTTLSVFGCSPYTLIFDYCTYNPTAYSITKKIPYFQLVSGYEHQFHCACGNWRKNSLKQSPVGLSKDELLQSIGQPKQIEFKDGVETWFYFDPKNVFGIQTIDGIDIKRPFYLKIAFNRCWTYNDMCVFH